MLSGQWWSRSRESAQCNEAEASPYRRCHPFRCGLDACSLWREHSRQSSSSGSGSGSATVELTLWGTYGAGSNSAQKDALEKEIIPAFEKANPGITIKYVDMPYDGLKQKLTTGAAAGELPDLIRTDLGWNAQFAKLGVLKQLDGNMPNYEALASKVYPGLLGTTLYNGHHYGLPLDTNTRVLTSNPDGSRQAWASTRPLRPS